MSNIYEIELQKPSYLKDLNDDFFEFEIEGTALVSGKNENIYIKAVSNWNNFDSLLDNESIITIKNDLPISFSDLGYEDLEKLKKILTSKLKSSMSK